MAPKSVSQSSFSVAFSPSFGAPDQPTQHKKKQDGTAQPNTAKRHNTHHSTHNSTPQQTKQRRPTRTSASNLGGAIQPMGLSWGALGPLLGTLGGPKWCPRGWGTLAWASFFCNLNSHHLFFHFFNFCCFLVPLGPILGVFWILWGLSWEGF